MPGRAEPALKPVLLPEPFLDRMELSIGCQALDRLDAGAVGLNREHGAGLDRLAVDQHGAGATLRGVAADVGAGQTEHVANVVNQKEPRLDIVLVGRAVNRDLDLTHCALPSSFVDWDGRATTASRCPALWEPDYSAMANVYPLQPPRQGHYSFPPQIVSRRLENPKQ